ncbi:MAG: hypothetical protein JNM80_06235 [Phycisphaerae bacterium]|nr:hypothetical protein [Phycisphaerae bacterium]
MQAKTHWWAIVLGGLGLLASLVAGCEKRYSQETPEKVLETAQRMVADGNAARLTDLIYADTPELRRFLKQMGVVMGSLQTLGEEVTKAFPKEIEKLRTEAEAAAAKGEASSFVSRMAGMAQQGAGGPGGMRAVRGQRNPRTPAPNPDEMSEQFNLAMKDLFADPYGWLSREKQRLTVQQVADDRAALLWDGKPVLGVGLTMQLEGGKWYIVLPTGAPGVGQIIPKSEDGWKILGSLMKTMNNMLVDLTKDVRTKKVRRMDELAQVAGEKAFIPAVMVFFAYGKAMDEERKERQATRAPRPEASPAASTPKP